MIDPGTKFNSLTAIRSLGRGRYEFRCDCGAVKAINGSQVKFGAIKSCGCQKSYRISESRKRYYRDLSEEKRMLNGEEEVKISKYTRLDVCPICGWRGSKLGTHVKQYHLEYTPEEFYVRFLLGKIEGHRGNNRCMNPDCSNMTSFEKISKGYRKYCSNSCGAKITTPDRYRKMTSEERDKVRRNQSVAIKKWWSNISPEEYKRIQELHSRKMVRMIADGRMPHLATYSHVEQGWHKSAKVPEGRIFYRSSWELTAFEMLDNSNRIVSYSAPGPIPYSIDGVTKHYYPDIFILYADGSKKLIEIKPEYYINDPKVLAKSKAAKEWASVNNIEFIIWTEKNMGE